MSDKRVSEMTDDEIRELAGAGWRAEGATFTEWGVRYEIGGDANRIDPCVDEETAHGNFARWPHDSPATPICVVKRQVTYSEWRDTI